MVLRRGSIARVQRSGDQIRRLVGYIRVRRVGRRRRPVSSQSTTIFRANVDIGRASARAARCSAMRSFGGSRMARMGGVDILELARSAVLRSYFGLSPHAHVVGDNVEAAYRRGDRIGTEWRTAGHGGFLPVTAGFWG
jgi:hypothetical protein